MLALLTVIYFLKKSNIFLVVVEIGLESFCIRLTSPDTAVVAGYNVVKGARLETKTDLRYLGLILPVGTAGVGLGLKMVTSGHLCSCLQSWLV